MTNRQKNFENRMHKAAAAAIGSPITIRVQKTVKLTGTLQACAAVVTAHDNGSATVHFDCVVEAGCANVQHSITLRTIPGVK